MCNCITKLLLKFLELRSYYLLTIGFTIVVAAQGISESSHNTQVRTAVFLSAVSVTCWAKFLGAALR